jgi:hypothetical protein
VIAKKTGYKVLKRHMPDGMMNRSSVSPAASRPTVQGEGVNGGVKAKRVHSESRVLDRKQTAAQNFHYKNLKNSNIFLKTSTIIPSLTEKYRVSSSAKII